MAAQEHRRETQIDDVDLVKHDTVKNQRTRRRSGDQKALFVPSWSPLAALLRHSWGTVGAYLFDIKKNRMLTAP